MPPPRKQPGSEPNLPMFGEPAPAAPPAAPARKVLSVSQLNRIVRDAVESAAGPVWVAGEVSNFRPYASGHAYFSLKDEHSLVSAVLWRSAAARLRFAPADGMSVLALGRPGVYEPRGQYQFVVERLEPRGVGALELAFRQMCDKLRAEGLFDPARKRRLPLLPRRIALVTSPSGAAVQDMLQVIRRRCPRMHVIVFPVRVQGEGAADEIARGVDAVNRLSRRFGGIDVMIVGRGGGSAEDLWAFNEECVARAIYRSAIPVVSAVGHETDVSVADLVADVRALTPTEAAERTVPVLAELEAGLDEARRRLIAALSARAASARAAVESLARRRAFAEPRTALRSAGQRLDEAGEALHAAVARRLSAGQDEVAAAAGRLEALSPLKVLARGYALVQKAADGSLVRRPADVSPGDRLRIRLADGEIPAEAT
jgi:exodeoxyribonuclease VII large subunit